MWITIVNTEQGRVSKYQTFDTEAEALAHQLVYGGTVSEIDDATLIDHILITEGVISISTPAPTIGMVLTEFNRRLNAGFDYNFGDERGIHHIGTTPEDMVGWNEVTSAAQAMIALGQPSLTITVLTNTGFAVVTAIEWMMILAAAAAHRQPIWSGSFWLQSQNPIPADYATNELYWGG